MTTPKKNPPTPVDYYSLNMFILGTMAEVKRKEVDNDTGDIISKLADKVIKNNLTAILDKKRKNDKSDIQFFNTATNILIENTDE